MLDSQTITAECSCLHMTIIFQRGVISGLIKGGKVKFQVYISLSLPVEIIASALWILTPSISQSIRGSQFVSLTIQISTQLHDQDASVYMLIISPYSLRIGSRGPQFHHCRVRGSNQSLHWELCCGRYFEERRLRLDGFPLPVSACHWSERLDYPMSSNELDVRCWRYPEYVFLR